MSGQAVRRKLQKKPESTTDKRKYEPHKLTASTHGQGELILREEPLLRIPTEVTTYSPGALLLSALAGLSPRQRESFYNLSYVNLPSDTLPGTEEYNDHLALAIFQTNAVATGDKVGLFPRMARINHGCSSAFNSIYTWRENEGVLVIHALKPIKMGEELLTTYLDTKRPRVERQQHLRQHYGFECQCAVCSLSDSASAESDKRLSKMAELYARFSTWQHGDLTGKEAIDIAREIWVTGEKEGYWSERGQLAADAALVAAAHSDKDAVRAWAELAKKWYTYEVGADSEQVRWIREVLANPIKHQMWGSREEEIVGSPGPELKL
ncbi:hypothetical protein NM688_g5636 [Phlebia brevispora]|uniref:Uncharacterized protein n=1 Tax=Phlebia brevispora TaxID=194682 RepID=A0ACC1SS86_9APHY|nr:hypothetical protein NM688_g5636 [Phlebia brevispora]